MKGLHRGIEIPPQNTQKIFLCGASANEYPEPMVVEVLFVRRRNGVGATRKL
jgi:hypothetical protein